MRFTKLEDFYQVYGSHRNYVKAEVRKKHIRNFDEQFWTPASVNSSHTVLELGCGTGLFLAYLKKKGIENFIGVENDSKVFEYMPEYISKNVVLGDIWENIEKLDGSFDRIVMLDVFEHFSYFEGQKLLVRLKKLLARNGLIVLRIPNAASPFGLQYQYNDLTHKSVYGPGSIEHLALAAGFKVERRLSVQRGSRFNRFVENLLFRLLDLLLTEPPPLWGANMIVVLAPA